jgi:hypothetical protein
MTVLSAKDIGLAGIRFVRANPKSLTVWVVALAVLYLLGAAAFLTVSTPAVLAPQPNSLPGAGQWIATLGVGVVFFAANMGAWLCLYTGTLRAILRPSDASTAYLRLSRDEGRQLMLALLLGAVFAVPAFAGLVFLRLSLNEDGTIHWSALGLYLALVGGLIYPAIRMSLAGPFTFDTGRIDLRASWSLTKDRFWSLLRGYLLNLLVMVAVAICIAIPLSLVSVLLLGGVQDMSAIAAVIGGAVSATLQGALAALLLPFYAAPMAEAYDRLRPPQDSTWN